MKKKFRNQEHATRLPPKGNERPRLEARKAGKLHTRGRRRQTKRKRHRKKKRERKRDEARRTARRERKQNTPISNATNSSRGCVNKKMTDPTTLTAPTVDLELLRCGA